MARVIKVERVVAAAGVVVVVVAVLVCWPSKLKLDS